MATQTLLEGMVFVKEVEIFLKEFIEGMLELWTRWFRGGNGASFCCHLDVGLWWLEVIDVHLDWVAGTHPHHIPEVSTSRSV